eukprot:SAG22_NODE_19479_length_274_cov_1.114286_1_plen_37_part_10
MEAAIREAVYIALGQTEALVAKKRPPKFLLLTIGLAS